MEMLKFPNQYDFLFKLDNHQLNKTKFNYIVDNFDLYADSYKTGADRLAKLFAKNPVNNETLVYPIVHLYRQYIEWKLKELIRRLNYLTWKGDEFPTYHRLNLLWKEFAQLVETAGLDVAKKDMENAAGIIDEFHAMDVIAITMRYPTNEQGEAEMMMEVDVLNLMDVMKRMSQFFDFIRAMVRHYESLKNEVNV